MRSRDALDAPEALVLTMVLVAAADGGMSDREIGVMAGLVQTLPAFHDFTTDQLRSATDGYMPDIVHRPDGGPARLLPTGLRTVHRRNDAVGTPPRGPAARSRGVK